MTAGIKANVDGSAAIQVGGTDVITLTSGGAATFLTSPTTVQAGTAAAPSITFSGDTNTGIYSPGADQVAIATGGSQRVAVDSGGNFSAGISPLVVSSQKTIVFGNSNTDGVQIRLQNSTTGTTSTDGVLFSLTAGATPDAYLWNYENASTIFGTNNTERMRINAGAPILCLSGGNTSATGTGIAFPATQSASSDANTLDDYEEGTWTPTFSVGGTTFTGRGWYTKIGVVCHIGFNNLEGVNAISDGATAIVTGLPFNIKQDSGTNNYKFGAGIACIFSDASDGYNNKPLVGRINPATPIGGQASAAKIDFRNISGVATTTSDPFSFGGSYITE